MHYAQRLALTLLTAEQQRKSTAVLLTLKQYALFLSLAHQGHLFSHKNHQCDVWVTDQVHVGYEH